MSFLNQSPSYQLWQSWSPTKPNIFHWPQRDYSPLTSIAPENDKPIGYKQKPPITGWCSWYSLGENINQTNLLEQAKLITQYKPTLEYFLIDDGWCHWGDWQHPHISKFPNFPALINKLRTLKLKPGLWLAPFLVDHNSKIFHQHQNWLVRDCHNQPLRCLKVFPFDSLPFYRKYLIDFSLPEVKNYLFTSIDQMIRTWGIKLLKLDFLYAPYFQPSLTNDLIPHQYLTELFKYLKRQHPHIYTIACGCPLKPARYLVDAIRFSKDISWPALNKLPWINKIFTRSRFKIVKNNFRKLSNQSHYFHLDPDVHLNDLPINYYQQFNLFFSGEALSQSKL